MNPHTVRTQTVYNIARAVGFAGDLLAEGVMISRTPNLVVRFNPSTGGVQVRDRWNGQRLFLGSYDRCFICAPTTLAESAENEHADIDLDDMPHAWQVELQNELREVAA